jgi:MFS family permease
MTDTPARWTETDVPARLDRLPWSRWHWLVVVALGITWVLDGLEVTLAGSVAGVLKDKSSLGLTDTQVGLTAAAYLAGAVLGALGFGYLTDRLGRKKLFTVTLLLYLAATLATAFSWNLESYLVFRFFTGAGIGGEYSAINSAIDELIPARVRGRVDLIINSTFWLGAALGAAASILLLDPARFAVDRGWRYAFGIGAVLGLGIMFLRHWVPESPRWLMTHGRNDEAETIVGDIEREVSDHPDMLAPVTDKTRIRVRDTTPWSEIWHAVVHEHRSRSLLGLSLMVAQAFFYNAIFFTYALVLGTFYGVAPGQTGLYLFPFAIGNFIGPLVIGRLFDTIGRKPMIVVTYGTAGILLALSGWLFREGLLTATTQVMAWTAIFFIASSAASAAYLTVSEIFPLEIRGMAIAVFYAAGTLVGGVGAPALYGALIGAGSREPLFWGYVAGGALMIAAAGVEALIGVKAEGQSLEAITRPLSAGGG